MGQMMNKYFLVIFIIVLYAEIFSQQVFPEKIAEDSIYAVVVEEMPELIGGVSAIEENLYYTDEALDAKIEGKIFLVAYVDENGDVKKVKIIKGLGYGLDEVATNAMLKTKFKPGKQDGVAVKVQVSFPLVFSLE